MAQAGALSEDKPPRQGARKTLWLTLLASVLVHATLLTLWTPRPAEVKAVAPEPNLNITLNAAVKNTATAQAAPEQESPAVEEPITTAPPLESTAVAETELEQDSLAAEELSSPEAPPSPENTEAAEGTTPDKPRVDIHALDIATHPLPATREPEPGNVFHPGLRGQIREARTRRERLRNTEKSALSSWQDASGKTWVDLGDGTCMRRAGDTGGRTGWELPTRCKGQLTEGESMLRAMQRTLDRR